MCYIWHEPPVRCIPQMNIMHLLSNNRIAFKFILVILAILLLGCRGDPEAAFVDFSDRMVVERSGNESRDDSYFKVAVGSIFSAQETVVHYHELLEYIAGKFSSFRERLMVK